MSNATELIFAAYQAKKELQLADEEKIISILNSIAEELKKATPEILIANAKDVALQAAGDPKIDRLQLTEKRIEAIANSMNAITHLPDPTGQLVLEKTLYNGLLLQKITVPLGVVGAIFESRPNVLYDIASLCLRSRNACVLKGSIEAANSNQAAIELIHKVLEQHQINKNVVTLLPPQREVVADMFTAEKYIDVIIPRGSNSLIQYVRKNSLVPVIETGAGICHIYVESEADLDKAVSICVNAKTTRPAVCNAVDCIIVDKSISKKFLPKLAEGLLSFKVSIFAEDETLAVLNGYPYLSKATEEDFNREFLSLACAIKQTDGLDEALEHIEKYSTRHSEAIVSENPDKCKKFLQLVDAASVYSNASTRFTDGEEFGLGAEIGISTQKLHARGPFALEKLVTEKWVLQGNGQIR